MKSMGGERILKEENYICNAIFDGLKNIKGVKLYEEKRNLDSFAPVLSFNIDGKHSETVCSVLDRNSVAVRGGFHCSVGTRLFWYKANGNSQNFTIIAY